MTENEDYSQNSAVATAVSSAILDGLKGAIVVAIVLAIVGAVVGFFRGFDLFNLIGLGDYIIEGAVEFAIEGAKLGAIGGAIVGGFRGLGKAGEAADAKRKADEARNAKIEEERRAEKERKAEECRAAKERKAEERRAAKERKAEERRAEKERKAEERKAKKERKAKAEREAKIESDNVMKFHDAVNEAIRFASDAAILNARIAELEDASPTERMAAKALEDAHLQGNSNTRKSGSPTAIEAARIAGIETAAKRSIDRTCKAVLLCTKVSAEKRLKAITDARKSAIERVIHETAETNERKTIAKLAQSIESVRSQSVEDARKLAAVSKNARIVTHVEKNVIERAIKEARLVATKAIVEKSSDYRIDFRNIVAIKAMLSISIFDAIEATLHDTCAIQYQDEIRSKIESDLSRTIQSASKDFSFGSSGDRLNVPIHNYKQLPKLESSAGYVYVIKDIDRTQSYKIGRTNHPETRMNNFGVTLPFETKVIAILKADDDELLEKRLHKKFAGQHKRGEWFDLSDSQIREIQKM